MKLRFRPATPHFDDFLDTKHVRTLWHQVGPHYLEVLEDVTGLAFAHQIALVRCGKLPVSKSGKIDKEAIWLATHDTTGVGNFKPVRRADDDLLAALTHELCHRLLAEHRILLPASTSQLVYKDHRLLYTFLYDSWVAAFGRKKAKELSKFESAIKVPAYHKAWTWAMHLSAKKRAKTTAQLARHTPRLTTSVSEAMQEEHLQPLPGGEQAGGPPPEEMHPMQEAQVYDEAAEPQENLDPAQTEESRPNQDHTAPEQSSAAPTESWTAQGFHEGLYGLKESTEFDKAMQAKLAENANPERTAKSKEALESHGISPDRVDPAAAPEAERLANLTDADWDTIREGGNPLLALWSRTGRREVEQGQAELSKLAETDPSKDLHERLGPQDPKEKLAEEALRRSLPLVHGTSFEALMAATEEGKFISNRAAHEKGIDVTAGAGNTRVEDRELGLDNYVFADYARPHMSRRDAQPEVTVVLEPEAMLQEGAFVTERDVLDKEIARQDGSPNFQKYMRGVNTGEDFAHVVLPKLHSMESTQQISKGWEHRQNLRSFAGGVDSNPDQLGQAQFSTWEVKLPETTTQFTRKVIFKKPEQAAAFREKYGDKVPWEISVEPELSKHPEAFGTRERYQQEYEQAMQGDYTQRLAAIEATAPEDLIESYVILDKLDSLPGGVDPGLVRAEWFKIGTDFASAEEALAKAQEGHTAVRRRQYGTNALQIHTPQVEIARVVSNGNVSVVVEHQPHNLAPPKARRQAV